MRPQTLPYTIAWRALEALRNADRALTAGSIDNARDAVDELRRQRAERDDPRPRPGSPTR